MSGELQEPTERWTVVIDGHGEEWCRVGRGWVTYRGGLPEAWSRVHAVAVERPGLEGEA